jgi:hypothetical protein
MEHCTQYSRTNYSQSSPVILEISKISFNFEEGEHCGTSDLLPLQLQLMDLNGVSLSLAKWSERLNGLTVAPLTRDYPEPSSAPGSKRPIEAIESVAASEAVSHALQKLHAFGSSYELVLAAYVILISRLTGDEDIALGTNARSGGDAFVLRVLASPGETFAQLLSKVKDVSRMRAKSMLPAD